MGLSNIQKKSQELGKKSKSSFLKINMYENPQMALDLIAHICTASSDIDVNSCVNDYVDLILEMDKHFPEGRRFINSDFLIDCAKVADNMCESLRNDVSSNMKIAVAGGFSAGKSSLLNAYTQIGSLLPTGIDPVSMVNTFINCSSSNNRLVVRGENIRGDVVLLNEEVLSCVQHASRSKVYVSSVLNKILLDTPVPPGLDGITFIDTPGYNNSDSVTAGSTVRDADKALGAIASANAVFWCVDSEAGTIPSSDIQFLESIEQSYGDVPIVVFFTKMDKKTPEDMDNILNTAYQICNKKFGSNLVDILGISCQGSEIKMKSFLGYSELTEIIDSVREQVGETDEFQLALKELDSLFSAELIASDKEIDMIEELRLKSIDDKKGWHQIYLDQKSSLKSIEDQLRNVLVDSYNTVMGAADKYSDAYDKALKGWLNSLNREDRWSEKSGFFSDTSGLIKQSEASVSQYNRLIKTDLSYNYYLEDYRTSLCDQVHDAFELDLNTIKSFREECEDDYKEKVALKGKEGQMKSVLEEFEPQLKTALRSCYEQCKMIIIRHNKKLQALNDIVDDDIYSAIYADNWKRFLACCSKGVDMTVCNRDGYSPLTLSCKLGNNEMVKFFIDNGADLSAKDERGFNAVETAVSCHYQDICELFYATDRSLFSQKQVLLDIAKQNTFNEWLMSK